MKVNTFKKGIRKAVKSMPSAKSISDISIGRPKVSYEDIRKKVLGNISKGKLDIPAHMMDPNYKYRWVKEFTIPNREAEHWEVVQDKDISKYKNSMDPSVAKIMGGRSEQGSSYMLILMRKPKELYNMYSKIRQEEKVDKIEKQIISGEAHKKGFDGNMYIKDSNKIGVK